MPPTGTEAESTPWRAPLPLAMRARTETGALEETFFIAGLLDKVTLEGCTEVRTDIGQEGPSLSSAGGALTAESPQTAAGSLGRAFFGVVRNPSLFAPPPPL